MARWFRFYDDALNDPKVQKLSPKMFKNWVNILCLASKNDGEIPPIEDVAFSLRMPETEAASVLDKLNTCGLIDGNKGVMKPHNWNARQYKSDVSTDRVKQFRERQGNVSETPRARTEQNRVQKQSTETDTPLTPHGGNGDLPDERFEEFWKAWPARNGFKKKKAPALLKWGKMKIDQDLFEIIMGSVEAHHETEEWQRGYPPDAVTWLNQRGWENEIGVEEFSEPGSGDPWWMKKGINTPTPAQRDQKMESMFGG